MKVINLLKLPQINDILFPIHFVQMKKEITKGVKIDRFLIIVKYLLFNLLINF